MSPDRPSTDAEEESGLGRHRRVSGDDSAPSEGHPPDVQHVRVRTMDQLTHELHVDPSVLVSNLKSKICNLTAVPMVTSHRVPLLMSIVLVGAAETHISGSRNGGWA